MNARRGFVTFGTYPGVPTFARKLPPFVTCRWRKSRLVITLQRRQVTKLSEFTSQLSGSKIAYCKLEKVSSSYQRASAVRRGAHYDRAGGHFRQDSESGQRTKKPGCVKRIPDGKT
jgi:hypothetical protein